jgi:hypothetical protein
LYTSNISENTSTQQSTQISQIKNQIMHQKKVREMRFDQLSAPFGWKQIIAVLHQEREERKWNNSVNQVVRAGSLLK